ncbi:MAG: hypothetical protein K2X07_08050 [Caulobacteraceae bacterium]|nr:hypothetical protein [Caulobacteraceae bacterium]
MRKPLFPNLRRPPHRPLFHALIALWMGFLAFIGARIWLDSLAEGVLDVRGPALIRADQPELYWLAMVGAAATLVVVVVTAVLGLRALVLNLRRGRSA